MLLCCYVESDSQPWWSHYLDDISSYKHFYRASPSSNKSHILLPLLMSPPSFLSLHVWTMPQEEDSPDNGEMRRAETSPTPLKRDRSFSEHDLALLHSEMLPSLSDSVQLGGGVRLRDERPRSRTLSSSGPPPLHRGQCVSIGCFK